MKSLKSLVEEMRGITEKAKTEKRNLTADECTRFESLESEFDSMKAEIERSEAIEERTREFERLERTTTERIESRSSERETTVSGREKNKGFETLGEQLRAIVHAGITHRVDPRLIEYRGDSMMEASPAEGGFLVQHEDLGGIMQRSFEISKLASKCRRLPIGKKSSGLTWLALKDDSRATGSRFGGLQVYWLGEGEKLKYTKANLEERSIKLQKIGAMVRLTDELQEDATALEGMIREFLPQEFAFALDDAVISGTGVGQMLGLKSSGAAVTVAKETSQTAATVNFTNAVKMEAALHAGLGGTPEWYCNKNVKPQLLSLQLATGNAGVPIYLPAAGPGGVATLFGKPVVEIEQAETLGTVGDFFLADLSQYWIIEKGDMRVDSSMHVFFDTSEQALRFIKRINGQPCVNKPITPYKGANGEKHSPFVLLATRA